MLSPDVLSYIKAILPEVVDLRHTLHAFPELGYEEFETAKSICRYLEGIEGLEIQTALAITGITVTLGKSKPGKCIALRADMDCLPIQEKTDKTYQSKRTGLMHACGHDGHTAILLGVIKVLSKFSDRLNHPVKFIFQPAEEFGAGGKAMIEAGALDKPEVAAIFGLHGWPHLPLGSIGVRSKEFFAGVSEFRIKFIGKGGHIAFPKKCINPLIPAAKVLIAASELTEKFMPTALLGIGAITGGEFSNVVPSEAILKCTVRYFNKESRDKLLSELASLCKKYCDENGSNYEMEFVKADYPPLLNSELAVELIKKTATDLSYPVSSENFPVMTGEDFAFYLEKIPGAFFALGVCPADSSYPELHNDCYDFPDQALVTGISMFCGLAFDFKA